MACFWLECDLSRPEINDLHTFMMLLDSGFALRLYFFDELRQKNEKVLSCFWPTLACFDRSMRKKCFSVGTPSQIGWFGG